LDDPYDKIRAGFDDCLHPWVEARNNLQWEQLRHLTVKEWSEKNQLAAMLTVLKRIIGIRRLYGAVEIAAPVLFAVFAIVYVALA
jgi:hypothetical protein